MGIKGIGVDIEQVDRITNLINRYDEVTLQMIFTPFEIEQCKTVQSQLCYAICFSAKEAVSKSLGTGFAQIDWNELEVHIVGNHLFFDLNNEALRIAREKKIKQIIGSWCTFNQHVLVQVIAQDI